MTSLAFILGVMPLVFASGAGREARHSVGTAVAGGMIASTFLNLAFIPVLYVVVKSIWSANVRSAGVATAPRARRLRSSGRASVPAVLAVVRSVLVAALLSRRLRRRLRADAGAGRARHLRRGDRSRDREEPVGGDRRGRASCAPKALLRQARVGDACCR